MNDITREQAGLIKDIASYKTVTGAQRFKRTKEEMNAGLSPEDALTLRIKMALGEEVPEALKRGIEQAKAGQLNDGPKSLRASTSRQGDIALQLRPAAKTPSDYFEFVPGESVELVLEESWYAWFDTLAGGPFEGNTTKLLQYILNMGIGTVITKIHFPADIEEHERPVRTPEQVA